MNGMGLLLSSVVPFIHREPGSRLDKGADLVMRGKIELTPPSLLCLPRSRSNHLDSRALRACPPVYETLATKEGGRTCMGTTQLLVAYHHVFKQK